MAPGPTLTDGDVVLRSGRPEDLPALLAMFAEPAVRIWWGLQDEARVRDRFTRNDTTGWVVERSDEVVGWVQAHEELDPDYRHAGLDIATAGRVHGAGVAHTTLVLVRRWLVDTRGHHRITVDPAAENVRAVRAYAKAGFRRVGVMCRYERSEDGTWRDGVLMEWVDGLDPDPA